MRFADTYLERYSSGSEEDLSPPDPDLFFSVVIPVYREPDLLICLQSLFRTRPVEVPIEIILVFNYPENAPDEDVLINDMMISAVNKIVTEDPFFNVHRKNRIIILTPSPFKESKAGPGLARKIGMDCALSRFNSIENPDGVIVSLDADTVVDKDFFEQLFDLYNSSLKVNTSTCYFEHPRIFGGEENPNPEAILQYEIYLRVVKIGLEWTGFPFAFHTLGSAFSVRASAYIRAGGMGVQRSGEDFYFLHKCAQLGDFWENNRVKVYPSGRTSNRVLFGTGPFILNYPKKHNTGYRKYSWQAFIELKRLIDVIIDLDYGLSPEELVKRFELLGDPVCLALEWPLKILQARKQAGDNSSFKKWIWREIDGLEVIKYLNQHQEKFGSQLVIETAGKLLYAKGYEGCIVQPLIVLQALKKMDRYEDRRKIC